MRNNSSHPSPACQGDLMEPSPPQPRWREQRAGYKPQRSAALPRWTRPATPRPAFHRSALRGEAPQHTVLPVLPLHEAPSSAFATHGQSNHRPAARGRGRAGNLREEREFRGVKLSTARLETKRGKKKRKNELIFLFWRAPASFIMFYTTRI